MPKKIIDIVSNGATVQQGINFETDAVDNTTGAPVRALQVGGNPLSKTNPIPTRREYNAAGTLTPANGTTSATQGTVTQVLTASPTRVGWYIENNSLATMVIHRGAPGSSTAIMNLYPGQREKRSKDAEDWSDFDEGVISIQCPTDVNQAYFAGAITRT